jgi:two-component system sensor histidine kinase AgrC
MISIILITTEILALAFCIARVHSAKFRVDIWDLLLVVCGVLFKLFMDKFKLSEYLIVIFFLFILIYILMKYKITLGKSTIYLIVSYILLSMFQVILYVPVKGVLFWVDDVNKRGIVNNILVIIVVFLANKYFQISRIIGYIKKRNNELKWIVLMLLLTAVCVLFASKQENLNDSFFMVIIVFFITECIAIYKWAMERNEAEKEKLKNEIFQGYNGAYEELIKGIRERQHEFNNHINAIFSLHITAKSYEELVENQREYCNHLTDENQFNALLKNVGCPVFIGFLYIKLSSADRRGINVYHNISVGNMITIIPVYELIEIVGILLDNAVEAILFANNNRNDLRVEIFEHDKDVFIEVLNPFNKETDRELYHFFEPGYTTKGKGRGIGLTRVKSILKKYNLEPIVENRELYGMKWICFRIEFKK